MPEKIFDKADLIERLLGDEELAKEVIAVFLDNVPTRFAELKDALDKGDANRLRGHAHAVKGAAMTISAPALKATAHQMEHAAMSCDMEHAATIFPEMAAQFEILKNTLVQAWIA